MLNGADVFVDPEIAAPGDGRTPATALAVLPPPDSLSEKTKYWIRRTGTPIVWGEGFSTVNVDKGDIYFIGMPKPGDWLWNATPQAAREAWGADEPEYADLKFGNPSLSVRFRHVSGNGGVHRIRFLIPNETAGNSSANYGFLSWSNHNHSANYYEQQYDKAAFMTDCDWRVEGVDLDDPECVEVCRRTINSWFSFFYFKNVHIRGCRFVYPGQQDSSSFYSHTPFFFNYCQRAAMTDCDFWIGAYGYNRVQRPLCYFENVADVTFSDNRNHYVVPQTTGQEAYLRGWYYVGGTNHTRRNERLWSRIVRFYDDANRPSRLTHHGEIIRAHSYASYLGWDQTRNKPVAFDADIDVDTTPCWESHDGDYNPESNSGYSMVYLSQDNNDNGQWTQFSEGYTRNIRVVVPREGGIGRANIPYALYLERPNAQQQGETLTGIEARNYRGGALYLNGATSGSYEGRCGLPPMELGVVEGGIHLRNCGLVTVDRLEVGRPDRFLHVEGTTAYFDRIVAPAEQWNNHFVFLNANHSRVVINRINVPVLWPNVSTYGRCGIIVNSDGGVEGRWKARNGHYFGENWNARREGCAATSSIKLWGIANARLPLQVGFDGFKNFRVAAPSPGRYLLRVYGAYKMFSEANIPFLSRRVVVKARVKTVVGGGAQGETVVVPRWLDSQTCGWWEADAGATWHNDDGLNPVCCVMPIDLPDTGNNADLIVDWRVEYDWNDEQGYFHLVPSAILDAVDSPAAPRMAAPAFAAMAVNMPEAEASRKEADYFFVTSADRYHTADCPYGKTGERMTAAQILAREGIPCKHCHPPWLNETGGGGA